MRLAVTAVGIGLAIGGAASAAAHPSEPGVVSYAVLGKGSVGNIVGAPMGWEAVFTEPFQAYSVDLPVCNNWAEIGLPEVYNDPDLAAFNGATAQTSASDQNHLVKQAVGVFATNDAADRAFHRVVDRTVGCSGQTTAMHLDNGTTQVWSFSGGPAGATDAGGPSRRREPIAGASFKPGCVKTCCSRPRSANLATPARRSMCWPGRCRTRWASSRGENWVSISLVQLKRSGICRCSLEDEVMVVIVSIAAHPAAPEGS